MSAVAAFVNDQGIVFAADAAMYDLNGVVKGFVSKLYALPKGDGFCSSVGIYGFLDEFAARLEGDFDQIVREMVDLSSAAYNSAVKDWAGTKGWGFAPRATLIMGGYSTSRQRFEAWKIHSSEKPYVNAATGVEHLNPAWEPIPVSGLWASSLPREADLERFGIDYSDDNFNAIDMVARLVCANRAQSGPSDHDGVYGVGGRLDMALLSQHHALQWTAHEWPDLIGEAIDPTLGDPTPNFPLVIPWPAR